MLLLWHGFVDVLSEVLAATLPLVVIFIVFQVFFLRLTWKKARQLATGIALAMIGLALFLHGVKLGFLPAGEAIGATLGAGKLSWLLVPLGFLLGVAATVAEPAVRVLNYEVSRVSAGFVPPKLLLYTLAVGVGCFVALAMLRTLIGFPLWWILAPGYVLAFVLARRASAAFVSIAFDSGGVATGPMVVTFVLAISLGAATSIPGHSPVTEGFGLVALVALAPILAVLILGMIYSTRQPGTTGRSEQR